MSHMDKVSLIRSLLSQVEDTGFLSRIYSSDGFDGWDTRETVTLTAPQILYLIKKEVSTEDYFEGLEVEEFDLDAVFSEVSLELSWPDGYPTARVNSVIPAELEFLRDKLENLDKTNQKEVSEIQDCLHAISSAEYTFDYTIEADVLFRIS